MPRRSWLAAFVLWGGGGPRPLGFLFLREGEPAPAVPAPAPAVARSLPGLQPGGHVLLPNQWSLRPAGKQVPLGDFPVNLALHPTGRWAAVLHAGHGTHEVQIVDLQKGKERV